MVPCSETTLFSSIFFWGKKRKYLKSPDVREIKGELIIYSLYRIRLQMASEPDSPPHWLFCFPWTAGQGSQVTSTTTAGNFSLFLIWIAACCSLGTEDMHPISTEEWIKLPCCTWADLTAPGAPSLSLYQGWCSQNCCQAGCSLSAPSKCTTLGFLWLD